MPIAHVRGIISITRSSAPAAPGSRSHRAAAARSTTSNPWRSTSPMRATACSSTTGAIAASPTSRSAPKLPNTKCGRRIFTTCSRSSRRCPPSVLFALKYPHAVRALLLWRVTGGPFAAARLTENYYGKYIQAAQEGGMAAVCELDHFKERIEARPANRAVLMAIDPKTFIAAMERWRAQFAKGAELPIIGASEKDLNSIKVPTCIIPGNDKTHNHAIAEAAHRMIAGSELHDLFPGDLDVDLVPPEDWAPKEGEMAAVFADFLKRAQAKAA